jgi:hypothetical protein
MSDTTLLNKQPHNIYLVWIEYNVTDERKIQGIYPKIVYFYG